MSREIKLLIVDDDKDICEYVDLLLTRNGYNVDAVQDPHAVVNILKTDEYHLVVLDLMMPGRSGMELLEDIRGFDTDLPVIIFTGNPTVDSAIQSMRHNVSDYIKKPFEPAIFTATIDNVLRERGLLTDPEEALLQTIGDNIRAARKARKLTLKQMARRTGLSVSLLSQIERAESSASVSSLFKLANALECRLADFFGDY